MKSHEVPAHGKIVRLLAEKDCGFIETPDGREIYFPHLYLTYCFMNLAATVTYEAMGRAVFLRYFSWYFSNGYDNWLLTASIIVFFIRVKWRQMEQLPPK